MSHVSDAFFAINSISDGIITVDNHSLITFMNRAAEGLTGWSSEEVMNQSSDKVFVIVNAVTREQDWHPLKAAMHDDERYSLLPNSVLIRKDGSEIAVEDSISPIHDAEGKVIGAAIIFRDVSLSRLMMMKALHRSNHDPLTTLPNRSLLQDRIQQALISIQHRQHMVAVLYIDIDGFKSVNDKGGHATGDLVLQEIAKRMARCIRSSDTLCRAGGDEFILLLADVGDPINAGRIAEKLLKSGLDPFRVDQEAYTVSLSVGIATCDKPAMDGASLIEHADAAMYRAKRDGGNRALHFVATMDQKLRKRASIEDELLSALERREFVLHYQPQIDLRTRKIVGVEALLRWQTSDRGLLPPLHFIPAAERSGLIVPIGQWVLQEALKQLRVWRNAGHPSLVMSINVSSVEIHHRDYIANLDRALKEGEYVQGSLMFELTETVLLQAEHETDVLSLLPERGIRLAIDDFGVGYSNLIYLRRFAVDAIKIDQYFVEHAATREQDALLVKAIMDLGKSLKKSVIAEGVETEQQLSFLTTIGCDQVQGYLLGSPMEAHTLVAAMNLQMSEASG